MITETVNDRVAKLRSRKPGVSKVPYGYFVTHLNSYIQCVCDGNGKIGTLHCSCGKNVPCCESCMQTGRIKLCVSCTVEAELYRSMVAKHSGMSEIQMDILEDLIRQELATPIDFEKLIAESKLKFLDAGKYLLLCSAVELPAYVLTQITNRYFSPADDGIVLEFTGLPPNPKWFRKA
ncbi:MAG: hypothetical protein SGJ20_19900 [Planctomycetota bacterium]|nr:hypothetical protein [Planctomycetota bacterium]